MLSEVVRAAGVPLLMLLSVRVLLRLPLGRWLSRFMAARHG